MYLVFLVERIKVITVVKTDLPEPMKEGGKEQTHFPKCPLDAEPRAAQ